MVSLIPVLLLSVYKLSLVLIVFLQSWSIFVYLYSCDINVNTTPMFFSQLIQAEENGTLHERIAQSSQISKEFSESLHLDK